MKTLKVKLYNPTQPQLDMIHIMNFLNPLISLFNFGRQTGKTFCSMNDAITFCLNNPKARVLFISPTYDNNVRIISDIEALFEDHKQIKPMIFKRIKYKEQDLLFHNGAVLSFRSAEQGDTLRGRKAHRIYVDEAAFISESIIVKILLPMVTRTGGRVILTSTPNGLNWWYEWFQRGQSTHKDFDQKKIISLKRTYLDLNDPEVTETVESFRSIMTEAEFNREVLAEFISDDTLFQNIDKCIHEIVDDKKSALFGGIDIGVSRDDTTVYIMDENYRVIDSDSFKLSSVANHAEFKQRLLYLPRMYKDRLVACYVEKNNQELLIDELETENMDIAYKLIPISVQAKEKSLIINNLRFVFDKQMIKIPNNPVLINQLYGYKAKRSVLSGKIQFQNKGVDHDDHVSGLGLSAYCVKEESNSGFVDTY